MKRDKSAAVNQSESPPFSHAHTRRGGGLKASAAIPVPPHKKKPEHKIMLAAARLDHLKQRAARCLAEGDTRGALQAYRDAIELAAPAKPATEAASAPGIAAIGRASCRERV